MVEDMKAVAKYIWSWQSVFVCVVFIHCAEQFMVGSSSRRIFQIISTESDPILGMLSDRILLEKIFSTNRDITTRGITMAS